MSEPEILRRCPVCGAASRPGTLFCPQCGNALAGRGRDLDAAEPRNTEDGLALDPRLQTRKLDDPYALPTRKLYSPDALPTRRLDSPESTEQSRRTDAESAMLNSESADIQTLDTLKSALQSALAQKASLVRQGKHDEARQLDSQIEKHKRALEAAVKNIMSSTARGSNVDASALGDIGAEVPYVDIAVDATVADFDRQPDSRINVEGATLIPPGALQESIRPRGEKLRKVSSVVLDGAAYDPSFRFVLVAAVLFVLFIVILVLSKVIT